MTALPPPAARVSLQGHFAGVASRFAAYLVDAAGSSAAFMLGLAAVSYAASIVTGHTVTWEKDGLAVGIVFSGWEFLYYAYCWGSGGRTLGMAILGLRVLHRSGAGLSQARAIVRTVAFPFSFLFLGLGFAGIVFQAERRALHDLIAGSVVVYDWDARAARLRFLARYPRPRAMPAEGREEAAGRDGTAGRADDRGV
jgi:uncharacterized RDD family membrane protein YckC